MSNISERLKKVAETEENVPFSSLTTLKVGGNARYVVYPKDSFALQSVLDICQDEGIPYKVLGYGSNMLCSDDEYNGVVIRLNRGFNQIYYDGLEVVAQAGCSVINLAYEFMKKGLSGMEYASGIPGTLGGSVFMNAGAYKSSMADVAVSVQVLRNNEVTWLSNEECEFGYRSSVFQKHPDWIILAARLRLKEGDKDSILALMMDRQARRFDSQPLEAPSAGSVFRNLEEKAAWKLIDEIGYRGKNIGGACVSDKHSNFIINTGNATASEINELIEEITAKVKQQFGLDMILEVERFNWKD